MEWNNKPKEEIRPIKIIQKINNTVGYLKQNGKHLTRQWKQREDKNYKYQVGTGDVTADTEGIKRIINKYYKQFYIHVFGNLDITDRFL